MLDRIMDSLYQPYLSQRIRIIRHAYALNNYRGFRYKLFSSVEDATPITKEAREYLDPLIQELQPIFDEQARIHAWLLRISNRLYQPNLVLRLLPDALLVAVPLMHSTEKDLVILRAAEANPEYTLIRKRLLLRTML